MANKTVQKGHGRGGPKRVITPKRLEIVTEEVGSAGPGEKRAVFKRLGKRFRCHWRTVENAYKSAVQSTRRKGGKAA